MIELDIPDDLFIVLCKQAHELGRTLNDHLLIIVLEYIIEKQREELGRRSL